MLPSELGLKTMADVGYFYSMFFFFPVEKGLDTGSDFSRGATGIFAGQLIIALENLKCPTPIMSLMS